MTRTILIVVGVAFLVVGIAAAVALPEQRPRLPVELGGASGFEVRGQHPERPTADHSLRAGDRLLEIDGHAPPSKFWFDFYLDGKRVGDTVDLVVERDGRPVHAQSKLVRSLSTMLLVINFLVSVCVWAFAMLVLLWARSLREAAIFAWTGTSLAVVMLVYWPENDLGFEGGQWLSLVLSNMLYPLTVTFLLHFALIYPEGWWRRWMRWLAPLIYLPALAVGACLVALLPPARQGLDPQAVQAFQVVFERALPIQLAVYFLLGLAAFAVSYRRTAREDSRQRLKWLFWGFGVAVSPHLLLYELPKAFGASPLIPEYVGYLFVPFGPVAFFISVVRHRLFDVNVVIRRSLVYSLLTIFLVSVYLMLVGLGDWLTVNWLGHQAAWLRVVVVLLLAAAFEPARRTTQKVVDRIFYRTQHDQRVALLEFSRRLAHTLDIYKLAGTLKELLDQVMPMERFIVFTAGDDEVVEVRPRDGEESSPDPLRIPLEHLPGLAGRVDSGAFEPRALPNQLGGIAMLVPLKVEERLAGLLALGPKRDGIGFKGDDHRFIKALAAQTAVAFDRARAFKVIQDMNVSLEQKVWKRTQQLAEANDRMAEQFEQLQQLNEMKEALSRMVVHDLKNPVSTILLGLEFLDRSEVGELPPNVSSTLGIISSTAQEIQDLISNLLDVYRMETGELNLTRAATPLGELFDEGIRRVKVLAQYRRVQMLSRADGDLAPELDRDLMIRVLVNLLTNAVKHSRRDGVVELTATGSAGKGSPQGELEIAVTNGGPIIPPELQARVFEKFFQVEAKKTGVIAGTGLGLTFCRLVVEAHGGDIRVDSPVPGREDGARFVVTLPIGPRLDAQAEASQTRQAQDEPAEPSPA